MVFRLSEKRDGMSARCWREGWLMPPAHEEDKRDVLARGFEATRRREMICR